jgi:hypothetical protein
MHLRPPRKVGPSSASLLRPPQEDLQRLQGRLRPPQEDLQPLQGRLRPPQEGLQRLQGRLRPPQEGLQPLQGRLRPPQEDLQPLQGRLRPPQEGLQPLQGRLPGRKSYVSGFRGGCGSVGSLQKRACPPREKSIRSCAIVSDVQNARSSLGQRLTSKLLGAPLLLILLTLLLTAVGGFGLSKLRNEEDILAFLPEGDAQVTAFKDVAKRFGALRVALIGVAPKNGTEVFSTDLLSRMERLSTALKNTQGVDRVVSLSTMTDLVPSEGGVDVMPLVPSPVPTDPATLAKLKARALSLPSVRGNCLSGDGKSALVMVFFSEGSKTRELAIQTRELARTELSAAASLYFGGAPFAGQSIYDDTQRDVGRLTPVALLLFFVVVLLAFWDAVPVFLTVVTVGLSAVLVLGGMGLLGVPFTVVTGTLPLILFASGSQYAIHILGRYYLVRGASPQLSPVQAAAESMRIAGPARDGGGAELRAGLSVVLGHEHRGDAGLWRRGSWWGRVLLAAIGDGAACSGGALARTQEQYALACSLYRLGRGDAAGLCAGAAAAGGGGGLGGGCRCRLWRIYDPGASAHGAQRLLPPRLRARRGPALPGFAVWWGAVCAGGGRRRCHRPTVAV